MERQGSVEAESAELAREPQQVVQRMVPVTAHSADAPSAVGSSHAQAAGSRRPAEGERHAVEPITSKHLEAELNRLEAELGR